MTIALTICAASFIALALVILNKSRELSRGAALLRMGSRHTDELISRSWDSFVYTVTHVSVREARHLLYRAVISCEKLFIRQFDKVSGRFAIVGDIVTGRDIPKNRGSVSFFLKNIETRKKSDEAVQQG